MSVSQRQPPFWLIAGRLVLICVVFGVPDQAWGEVVPLAPGYGDLSYELPRRGSYELPSLGSATDGSVLDTQGKAHSLHEMFEGKYVLLGFIYSRCSDVNGCPLTSYVFYKLKSMLQSRPQLAANLKLISLSFDPVFDTPAVISLYAQNFRYAGGVGRWDFLTTKDQASLQPILDGYGQDIKLTLPSDAAEDENISHLLRVYLIDPSRQIRNIYSVAFLHPDLVLRDLETLMIQETGDVKSTRVGVDAELGPEQSLENLAATPPLGLPALPDDIIESMTRERIALGKKLFFDRRLSLNDTFSCAMCHIPEQGFTSNELMTAVGIEGRTVRRNSPSLFNVAYMQRLFHDGREENLEQQIWGPLLNRNEMGNPSVGYVIGKIRRLLDYAGLFDAAFPGRGLGMETLGRALASYQRTLVSGNSPFDRWHFSADSKNMRKSTMNAAAQRGFRLFTGKAGCSSCHLLGEENALFTDHQLHNTGIGYARSMGVTLKSLEQRQDVVPSTVQVQLAPGVFVNVDRDIIDSVGEDPPADLGLYEITEDPADRWSYRTPGLRNIALTGPYMHDGSLVNLAEVIRFYNQGGIPNENLDPRIMPLNLSQAEQVDLIEFLQTLTGDNVKQLIRLARSELPGDTGLFDGEVTSP